jgi:hypothetical protein
MATLDKGMYRTADGAIFKVQVGRESGQAYAKRLQPIGGERLTETAEVVNFEFVYAPGAVRALSPEMQMTLEEAREFGIQYGVCAVCGARLKDATSVAGGIGPVCAKRTAWRRSQVTERVVGDAEWAIDAEMAERAAEVR